MCPVREPAQERSVRTRQALVHAARRLFVERGYAAVGTQDIVDAAGVGTRGAFYHHFPDKREIFRAVFEAVEDDLATRTAGALGDGGDVIEILRRGLHVFLDASARDPDVQRVVLIDGPSVLGWDEWREREAAHGLGAIAGVLAAAVDARLIAAQPIEPLAHMLLAAVDEVALYVANNADTESARRASSTSLDHLVNGLRAALVPPPPVDPAATGRLRSRPRLPASDRPAPDRSSHASSPPSRPGPRRHP